MRRIALPAAPRRREGFAFRRAARQGREIARLLGVEPRVVPVRMADVTFRAERPMYCVMSNAKLAAAGITMPAWQDAIARYVRG